MSERPPSPCWSCVHRRELPGTVHIMCAKAAGEDTGRATLMGWLAKRSGIAGDLDPRSASTFRPERRIWPGSGVWPLNYDPNTVFACSAHEVRP